MEIDLRLATWPFGPVKFRYRDGLEWLKDILSDPDVQAHLTFKAVAVYKDGERVWSQPFDSNACIAAQEELQNKHGEEAELLALQVMTESTTVHVLNAEPEYSVDCTHMCTYTT